MSGQDDAQTERRSGAPWSPRKTIPTISRYQEEKEARRAEARDEGNAGTGDDPDESRSRLQQAKDAYYDYQQQKSDQNGQQGAGADRSSEGQGQDAGGGDEDDEDDFGDEEPAVDTSETNPVALDPKQRRKGMKKRKEEKAERQVTDPVTHLPVTIHDFTSDALKDVAENEPQFGSTPRTATGLSNKSKSNQELQKETHEMQEGRDSMRALFPPPRFEAIRTELIKINGIAITIGLAGTVVIMITLLGLERLLQLGKLDNATTRQIQARWSLSVAVWLGLGLGLTGAVWALIVGIRDWQAKRIDAVWAEAVWEANRQSTQRDAKAHETESVSWLNSLVSAVWPLVNPDLFTSLADTLEDVMQASLPKIVQMVSVDDIGQGSESLRILGIRWLPTGAAARSVGSGGKLKSADDSKQQNDRAVPGEGEIDDQADDKGDKEQNEGDDKQKNDDGTENEVAQGMEAEEGDFVNMEVSFAYRARSELTKLKDRTKDMHLFLAFYLPGNIKLPVWVDLRGVVGTMRLRLQLTPDPPFFALCTLTFLGQPKVDVSCIPIVKRGLNIMNLPLISNFVQSSIDAAMAEYVAPKSLTLDLKEMLAGDDFKKDTSSRGVLVVNIKRG